LILFSKNQLLILNRFFLILIVLFSVFHAGAQTYTWNGHVVIHDMQSDTIPLSISGMPTVIDTNYGFAHICIDITHTYKSDLEISLISPAGTTVLLIQGIGGSGDNFTGTCLGMDGTAFSNSTAPYTGIFVPVSDVSAYNNRQNPNGVWRLIVKDIANSDTGFVNSFSIQFVNNPPRSGNPLVIPNLNEVYNSATCVYPGGAAGCDLLPDVTSSAKEILASHTETPGTLNISNATPNIGYGPIEIYGIDSCFCGTTQVPCGTICPNGEEIKHVIKQRIYQKVPGTDTLRFYDRFAGAMTYHPTHGHLHVDNWASYTLRSATSNPDARTWPIIGTGVKQSFCLINLGTCASNPGECVDNNGQSLTTFPNNNFGFHTGCGLTQGIYPGNYDVYSLSLNDPIELTNVCNGNYYIVSITDPENKFLESDETNNWVAVPITLAQQNLVPTITITGSTLICQGDSVILTASNAGSVVWSRGDTTKSIIVKTAGTYTAMNRCGGAVSSPVTITLTQPSQTASVAISVLSGDNPGCAADPITFSAVSVNGGTTPIFQWKVNGVNAGSNSSSFVLSNHINGQIVTCQLTTSLSCITNSTVQSNNITVQTAPRLLPSVTITETTGSNPTCYLDTVVYTATVYNGKNISYQWKRNGVLVGTNASNYSCNDIAVGETISCDVKALPLCDLKVAVGTGTLLNTTTSNAGAAYPTYYGNGRQQYLVLASELSALGLSAGYLNSLSFKVGGSVGNPDTLKGYTIKIAPTTASSLTTSFLAPTFTTVFGPYNYKPILNSINAHFFATPFYWNGTSNILVDICFANGIYGSAAYQTYYTTTSFPSSAYFQQDYAAGAIACSQATATTLQSNRPNMIFGRDTLVAVHSNTINMDVADTLYKFIGNGSWSLASNWMNGHIPPAILPSCSEIIIDPISRGECDLYTQQTILAGAKFTVMPTKKFMVYGKLYMY